MILGIQILGVFFALAMMYLTMHGYKRKQVSKQGIGMWFSVWTIVIILSLFPQILSGIGGKLNVSGTIDFLTLMGFAFFAVIIFYLHQKINKMDNKLEKLVRNMAFKEYDEDKKKGVKKR